MQTAYFPSLYPLQQKIITKGSAYRFVVLCCGRRFGKTSMMTWLCAQAILGKRIILFAPSPAGFMDTWREVVELVGTAATSIDKVLRNIYFSNGGFIKMRSVYSITEADKTRGQYVDYAIYEETQSFPSDVLKYHWENVIYPTLVDLEGRAFFIGTPPNSKAHYFARLYCLGVLNNPNAMGHDVPMDLHINNEEKNKPSSYISFRKTGYDNPYIKNHVLEQAKNDNPFMVFQQEYLAQFVDYNTTAWLLCFDENGTKESQIFRPVKFDVRFPFYLSFDFNLSPMAATLWQKDAQNTLIRCIAEFGAPKGQKVSIQYTTDLIKAWFYQNLGIDIAKGYLPAHINIYITGDATGGQADPRNRSGLSFYQLIEKEFNTTAWGRRGVYNVPKANITHRDSWQQMNSYLHQHPQIQIDPSCKNLRNDMKMTTSGENHEINKKAYDPHFLDTARYFFANYLPRAYSKR